jgi:hypothetical protein
MAQVVGAKSSYQEPIGTGGNREDLSDILYDVSPTDTPFLTLAKHGTASGTNHEWLTDALNNPAANAVVEGATATIVKAGSRTRLGNYTQILEKTASVTGTQEKADKAAVKSEMAYQVARRMKEIKRDLEWALIGPAPTAKVAGSDTVARKAGSFVTYLTADSYQGGATSVAPTGNGQSVPTPGTARPFTEGLLTAALQKLWTNSGGSDRISGIMGANVRGKFSGLTSTATRFVSTDDAHLQASIDVYDGDFHTVTAMPDRWCNPNSLFLIDKDYVSIDDFRSIFSHDLAVTGDAMSKQIIWETTLKVGNPLAHYVIDAIN